MDIDDDDDFYAPDEPETTQAPAPQASAPAQPVAQHDEDLEEGEEEDEGAEMDEDDSVCLHSIFDMYLLPNTNILGHRYHYRAKRWHKSSSANSIKIQRH